jgi:hypothetical protein
LSAPLLIRRFSLGPPIPEAPYNRTMEDHERLNHSLDAHGDFRMRLQKSGRFLSGMVMPTRAFIAWA